MKDWSLFTINLNNFPEEDQHHQGVEATGRRRKRAGGQTAEVDPPAEIILSRLMVPELRARGKSRMQQQHLHYSLVRVEEMERDKQRKGRAGKTPGLLQMIRPSRLLALQLARSRSRVLARNQVALASR